MVRTLESLLPNALARTEATGSPAGADGIEHGIERGADLVRTMRFG